MNQSKQAVYSSRTADKFVVRLPDGMRSQVEVKARQVYGSMNSYIIRAVENQLRLDDGPHDEQPVLQQQWMPEVNDAVWVSGGTYTSRPLMGIVKGKYVIYQAVGNPGFPGNDKPSVVLDVEYLLFQGDKFQTEKLEKIPLAFVTPAEL